MRTQSAAFATFVALSTVLFVGGAEGRRSPQSASVSIAQQANETLGLSRSEVGDFHHLETLGEPESVVAASLSEDGLHAPIRLATAREFWIEPLAPHVPGAGAAQHVVYETDAVVSGTFIGDYDETVNGMTNGSGTVILQTIGTQNGHINFMFCVDTVSGSLSYVSTDNVETCDND